MEKLKKEIVSLVVDRLSRMDDVHAVRLRKLEPNSMCIEIMSYPWISTDISDEYDWIGDRYEDANDIINSYMSNAASISNHYRDGMSLILEINIRWNLYTLSNIHKIENSVIKTRVFNELENLQFIDTVSCSVYQHTGKLNTVLIHLLIPKEYHGEEDIIEVVRNQLRNIDPDVTTNGVGVYMMNDTYIDVHISCDMLI